MTWANPTLLALLLLVPAALALVVLAWRARSRALAAIAQADVLGAIVPPGARRARGWQAALGVVSVAGLALAAAGPRLGFDWQQQKMEGVAIVVVLDVSRSMDAADVSPSRLQRARREITDFVGLLRGDSVGLVLFAAGAYPRIPLTTDYPTFLWALGDSDTSTIRAQGTSLSGALDAATQMLDRAGGTGKAVLLVSDGEGHDDDARIEEALGRAKASGVHVYALGVGDPQGAPIPLAEGGFKKDDKGDVVLTRLDEARLQALAAETGGAYVRAVASDDDVRALYVDEIRGKLEAAEHGVRREKIWHEQYQWPLGIAFGAMAISAALGIGRAGRRRLAKAAAVAMVAVLPLAAHASPRDDGLAALKAKDWAKAAEELGQARVQDPDDVQVGQALAEALYRSGRTREAEQVWQGLAKQDAAHKAIHEYNAGNAAYQGGRLPDALSHFQEALKADPKLEAAQKNADAVQKEIQLRLQQQQQQQQQKQDQQNQQKQDQQQQDQQQQQQQGQQQQDQQQQDQQQQQQQGGQQDQQQQGDQQDQQQGGQQQQQPSDDGTRQPSDQQQQAQGAQQQDGQQGDDQELAQDQQGTPSEDGTGEPMRAGEMTKDEAARLVDSVQDGKPRVVVGGRDTEKDW